MAASITYKFGIDMQVRIIFDLHKVYENKGSPQICTRSYLGGNPLMVEIICGRDGAIHG